MARRDEEMELPELLQWILTLKQTEVPGIGLGPRVTVVVGGAGYVVPGDWRPRKRHPDLEAKLAAWTC